MTLLIFELVLVSWKRLKHNDNMFAEYKIPTGFYLVISNVGVVNAYTAFTFKDEEKVDDIKNFVIQSSCISFMHHVSTLALIVVLGWHYPDYFEHWISPKFRLSPCEERFYWVFFVVLLIGVYSLTTTLYRARHITTVERKKTTSKNKR